MKQIVNLPFNTRRFHQKHQQTFLEDLAALLSDGLSLKEAIHILETLNQGYLKRVATSIHQALAQGKNLADGLSSWFSPTTVEIIRAGENSGRLTSALQTSASSLKQKNHLLGDILSRTLYPLIVFMLALIMLVMIKNSVLENFSTIKPVTQWPSNGIALFHFALFVQYGWWVGLLFLALSTFIVYHFITTYTGKFRHVIDQLPLLRLYRDTLAARFMQTLGLMIKNGILMKQALTILSLHAEPYLAWHLFMMEHRLSAGIENMAEVLDTQLLGAPELLRLKIMSQGKNFAPMLIRLGEFVEKRNQRNVLFLSKIISAGLLIASAFIAAQIILGIYAIGSILTIS